MGLRVGGRADFDQLGQLEIAVAQEGDHLARGEVEFDRILAGPFDPMHAEEGAEEAVAGRDRRVVGAAEDREDRAGEEDELAAGAQEARRLGDPGVGVAPDARPVLGDREVEGGVGVGDVLGVAMEEGELDPELLLEGARGRQLPGGVVDADRAGAAPGQPGGDITGAAAELDRVASLERPRQQADFRLCTRKMPQTGSSLSQLRRPRST